MRFRICILLLSDEEFEAWMKEYAEPNESGQDVIENALSVMDLELEDAPHNAYTTLYRSKWTEWTDKFSMDEYRGINLHLPVDAMPQVYVEFGTVENGGL